MSRRLVHFLCTRRMEYSRRKLTFDVEYKWLEDKNAGRYNLSIIRRWLKCREELLNLYLILIVPPCKHRHCLNMAREMTCVTDAYTVVGFPSVENFTIYRSLRNS